MAETSVFCSYPTGMTLRIFGTDRVTTASGETYDAPRVDEIVLFAGITVVDAGLFEEWLKQNHSSPLLSNGTIAVA